MANYASLKAAIQNVIKTNGNNEITGALLQQSLLAMINSLSVGYHYAGIATPSTNPGTPDQNVFYLAATAGTYSNFGGIVLAENEAAILKYNGTWTKDTSGFATSEKVEQIDIRVGDLEDAVGLEISTEETTTDNYVPTSYSGTDVEDPRQVLPVGKQLVGVTLFSTGASAAASSQLRIYDETRTLVDTITLGTIGTTDTYFDLSEYRIIIREGYHYSIYRLGYKWVSGLSVFVNPANNTAYSSSFYGFTFKYKEVGTKYDESISNLEETVNNSLVISEEEKETTTDSYSVTSYVNNEVEDPRQILPPGSKLLGIRFKSSGSINTAGASQLKVYNENRELVATYVLGQIGNSETYMDVSNLDIVIKSGYHYGVYRVGYAWVSGLNTFIDPRNGNVLSSSYYGFTFEYKAYNTKYDTQISSLKGSIDTVSAKLNIDLTGLSSEEKEMTIIPNYYITKNGSVAPNNSYSYTAPITLMKNQTVLLYGSGYLSNVAMISKVIMPGSSYTPLVISQDGKTKYTYVIEEDGDYAFSFNSIQTHRLFVINNSIIYLSQKVEQMTPVTASIGRFYCGVPIVGIIGDSMACGTGYDPYDGAAHEYPQYSWWKYMERESGMTYRRFARGGQTTRSFITDATYGLPAALTSGNECKLYIIGLEINDRSSLGQNYLGTVNDIDMSDPDNNADTYFGNYAKIIQKITAFNPKARFILFTNPRTESDFNEAIRTIAGLFSNCYLVDLYNKYHTMYEAGGVFFSMQDPSGHYPAIAYQGMSAIIAQSIDECITDNLSGFNTIQY